jgi:hydrogenase maturation protein HypF
MLLEAACTGAAAPLALPMTARADGVLQSDWAPLLPMLLDAGRAVAERAAVFHASLADTLLRQARQARARQGVKRIGLCGGVFQNRVLTEQACRWLQNEGFEVRVPEEIPVNDAGLSYGQVIEYALRQHGDLQ